LVYLDLDYSTAILLDLTGTVEAPQLLWGCNRVFWILLNDLVYHMKSFQSK